MNSKEKDERIRTNPYPMGSREWWEHNAGERIEGFGML